MYFLLPQFLCNWLCQKYGHKVMYNTMILNEPIKVCGRCDKLLEFEKDE